MTEIIQAMPTGRQLADAGVTQAQDNAERHVYRWTDRIMAEFRIWLLNQDGRFAVEDFREHVGQHHPELVPPTPQAWGAVGRLARTNGLVRFVGYRPARSKATRNHPVRIFVRSA